MQHLVQRNQARFWEERPGGGGILFHGPGGGQEAGPAIGTRAHGGVGAGVQPLAGAGEGGGQLGLPLGQPGPRLAQVGQVRLDEQLVPLPLPGGGVEQVGVEGAVAQRVGQVQFARFQVVSHVAR